MCVLTFLDDLLYYGYNTGSNRGSGGPPPRKILLELVQNPAILDNSGYITIRVETVRFETDWYIETHKYR